MSGFPCMQAMHGQLSFRTFSCRSCRSFVYICFNCFACSCLFFPPLADCYAFYLKFEQHVLCLSAESMQLVPCRPCMQLLVTVCVPPQLARLLFARLGFSFPCQITDIIDARRTSHMVSCMPHPLLVHFQDKVLDSEPDCECSSHRPSCDCAPKAT